MSEPIGIICAYCRAHFEWTESFPGANRPLYCQRRCKNKAGTEASRKRQQFKGKTCPAPWKRRHATATEAFDALQSMAVMAGAHPYLCNCGKFHVGRLNVEASS